MPNKPGFRKAFRRVSRIPEGDLWRLHLLHPGVYFWLALVPASHPPWTGADLKTLLNMHIAFILLEQKGQIQKDAS